MKKRALDDRAAISPRTGMTDDAPRSGVKKNATFDVGHHLRNAHSGVFPTKTRYGRNVHRIS